MPSKDLHLCKKPLTKFMFTNVIRAQLDYFTKANWSLIISTVNISSRVVNRIDTNQLQLD